MVYNHTGSLEGGLSESSGKLPPRLLFMALTGKVF